MTLNNDVIQSAKDFVRTALEKNFNQKIDDESARIAAEKLVRGLPESPNGEASRRAA